MKIQSNSGGKCRLSLCDAKTGKVKWRGPWENNLMLDQGLQTLAGNNGGYAACISQVFVGSGTSANEFNAGGSAVFTNTTTVLTCSANIFTSGMIGALFQYGATGTSGGVSFYITAFLTSATVSISTATTNITPAAGAVWMVQQTGLQTLLFSSNTINTGSGLQGFTISGNTLVNFRTLIIPVQGSSYNVNEVGYGTAAITMGRIVLSSTVTVPNTDFLLVTLQMTITQTPSSPQTVSNIGTGFNTAGNFMVDFWSCHVVNPSDGSDTLINGVTNTILDQPSSSRTSWAVLTDNLYPQQSSIQNSAPSAYSGSLAIGNLGQQSPVGTVAGNGGVSIAQFSGIFSVTTTGQTCFGFLFGTNSSSTEFPYLSLVLTTPQVLPNGNFSGSLTLQNVYSRTLVN